MFRTSAVVVSVLSVALCAGGAAVGDIVTGLIGYWNFEEGSGNTILDASGNGHDGTVQGTVVHSTDACPFVGSQYSADFGDLAGYIAVPHHADLNWTDDFTLAAWVKNIPSYYYNGGDLFFCKGENYLGLDPRDTPHNPTNAGLYFRSPAAGEIYSPTEFPLWQWHHVAMTYVASSHTLTFWVDGIPDPPQTRNLNISSNGSPLYLGATPWASNDYAGWIDEMRIYNRALPAADIAELINPPPPACAWLWNRLIDPAFAVGGDIPPCDANYVANIPAFVVRYREDDGQWPPNRVWAHKVLDSFAGDFWVSGRFVYVSEGYDLGICFAASGYDPVTESGQWVRCAFHNGWDDTLICGSRNAAGGQNYDASLNQGYPHGGDTYLFEFGRSGATLRADFYKVSSGGLNQIATRTWTTYNPSEPLEELWIVGADTAQGDGEAWFNQLRVCRYRLADMNCDGGVTFDDVDPFVDALSDPAFYQALYPNCEIMNGDCNGDGVLDFGDVNSFVDLLGG